MAYDYGVLFKITYRSGLKFTKAGKFRMISVVAGAPAAPVVDDGQNLNFLDPRAVIRDETGEIVYDGSMVLEDDMVGSP